MMADFTSDRPLRPRDEVSPSNAPMILAVSGLMTGLSLLVVILRIWVRQVVIKARGKDDILILCAMVTGLIAMVCFCGATANGAGHHMSDIGTGAQYERLQLWIYVMMIMLITGMSLVKISAGFFLLRFLGHTWLRAVIIGVQVFIAVSTIGCEAPVILQCIPVEAIFAYTKPLTAKCVPTGAFTAVGILNGSLNIFTDFALVIIPIPIILGLNMNRKTKATLIGILSFGLCVCTTAIVRVVIGARFFSPENQDYTWHFTSFLLNAAELHVGIITACLPTLQPLVAKFLATTPRSSENTPGSGIGIGPRLRAFSESRGGYLRQTETPLELKDADSFSWDQGDSSRGLACGRIHASADFVGSEDSILQVEGGIMKTREILVHKSK